MGGKQDKIGVDDGLRRIGAMTSVIIGVDRDRHDAGHAVNQRAHHVPRRMPTAHGDDNEIVAESKEDDDGCPKTME